MKIVPINEPGHYRTGEILGYTATEISKILGFSPNVDDDPSKVKYSWGFKADDVHCGIWDYKGSYRAKCFSTFGPQEIFDKLFPSKD